MAKLKNKFFGEISGKFGDAIFKQMGSSNYISTYPRKYNRTNSIDHQNRINRFIQASKFSSAVSSLPELKHFWDISNNNSSNVYNSIMRKSLKLLNQGHPITNLKITPEKGFGAMVSDYNLIKERLIVRLAPLTERSGINTNIETNIKLISVFNPYQSSQNLPDYEYFANFSTNYTIDLNNPIELTITLSTAQSNLIEQYSKCIVYNTLVTSNNEDMLINYANTFSSDLVVKI